MIILDTNVLSALMRDAPESCVVDWFDEQPDDSIWTTSITVFEIHFGIGVLPRGKRRSALEAAFEGLLTVDLDNRVLDFDVAAAYESATLAAQRRRAGKIVDMRDTQIAGIVLSRKAAIATRNVEHFADSGAEVMNPWA